MDLILDYKIKMITKTLRISEYEDGFLICLLQSMNSNEIQNKEKLNNDIEIQQIKVKPR